MVRLSAKYTSIPIVFGLLLSTPGCGQSNTPQGPEQGEIQRYLDENPDVAARVDEGVETDEDDGTGE